MRHVGSWLPDMDPTHTPCTTRQSFSYWSSRDIPTVILKEQGAFSVQESHLDLQRAFFTVKTPEEL